MWILDMSYITVIIFLEKSFLSDLQFDFMGDLHCVYIDGSLNISPSERDWWSSDINHWAWMLKLIQGDSFFGWFIDNIL